MEEKCIFCHMKTSLFVGRRVTMNRESRVLDKCSTMPASQSCLDNSYPAGEEMRNISLRYLNYILN